MSTTNNNAVKTVLGTGLLAGLLDGSAAIVQYLIKGGKHPEKIFQYIASAVFGEDAFSGGNATIIWGVVFHFAIAMGFTILFFFLYPFFERIIKNKIIIGLGYGIIVWVVMNLLIVPMTGIIPAPFKIKNAIIAALILMFMIGLPNGLIIGKYYEKKKT